MNTLLTAKGSRAVSSNSCISMSYFSAPTSLPWQIHKSLAEDTAVFLSVSGVIFLRWTAPPPSDLHRSDVQTRHSDTAIKLWWWGRKELWFTVNSLVLCLCNQTRYQWKGPLYLPGQIHGINKHITHFIRHIGKTSVCLKTKSQVFLLGFSTCEVSLAMLGLILVSLSILFFLLVSVYTKDGSSFSYSPRVERQND